MVKFVQRIGGDVHMPHIHLKCDKNAQVVVFLGGFI